MTGLQQHHGRGDQDEAGRRLGRARLAEGIAGITRLHELIAEQLDEDDGPERVVVGIETDRGPWVAALIAAGYRVYAINPLQVARYRERHRTSGAKSDIADAHTLTDMVRTDRHQLRPVAGDSDAGEAVKVLARAHQRLIWERTRHLLRLRSALREFFPAALLAFGDDLAGADALELLATAPDPASAARLVLTQKLFLFVRACRVFASPAGHGVVPVAVELVSLQVGGLEGLHLLVGDLDTPLVGVGIKGCLDAQPGLGGGRRDGLDDDLVGPQGWGHASSW